MKFLILIMLCSACATQNASYSFVSESVYKVSYAFLNQSRVQCDEQAIKVCKKYDVLDYATFHCIVKCTQ